MKDIRLAISFWDHPKTIKLKRRLGYEGVESLQRLWCFCAQYKQDGILVDMDADDIEIASRWVGDPGLFVDTLVSLRWIDANRNADSNANRNADSIKSAYAEHTFSLHAWEENNGFVAHAKERSDQARKAARARWEKKTGGKNGKNCKQPPVNINKNADSITTSNAAANANSNAECNAPYPNPTPNPNPNQQLTPVGNIDSNIYNTCAREDEHEFIICSECNQEMLIIGGDIPFSCSNCGAPVSQGGE